MAISLKVINEGILRSLYSAMCNFKWTQVSCQMINLPANRRPSEILHDRVKDTDKFLRVWPLLSLLCYNLSTQTRAYKQV